MSDIRQLITDRDAQRTELIERTRTRLRAAAALRVRPGVVVPASWMCPPETRNRLLRAQVLHWLAHEVDIDRTTGAITTNRSG